MCCATCFWAGGQGDTEESEIGHSNSASSSGVSQMNWWIIIQIICGIFIPNNDLI